MNCEYVLNGLKIGSLLDLYRYLDNKMLYGDASDIIFSGEEINRQQIQCHNIENIKETASENYFIGGTDEEGGFRGENGEFSIFEFFDNSGEATIDGERIYTPLEREEFKTHKINQYIKQGISLEEALLLVERELNSWANILKISRELHRIGISKFIGGDKESEFERKQNFILFAKSITGFFSDDVLDKLFNELTKFYVVNKGYFADSNCYRGINLKSKLANSSTELFTHIDYAIIDSSGNLHIYNFKVSSLSYVDWNDKKKEKYELGQAFLKLMLADNGIDVRGITIHDIPIKLTFNPTFTNVENVEINEHGIKYNNSKDNIAKYFIKTLRTIIKDPSKEEMDNTRELYDAVFPSLLIGNEGIMKSVSDWIKRAPAFGAELPITIREINDGQHRYVVTINGKSHLISDFSNKEDNKEIKDLVKKHIETLNEDYSNNCEEIVDAIKHSFSRKLKGFDFSRLTHGQSYLDVLLKLYISYSIENKKDGTEIITYNWEFIDTLADCGILLFRNKDTNLLDTIVLSSKNLNQVPKYDYGDNILGGYLTDRDFQWRGTYGNVETVRGIITLNTILPLLKDVKLGNIKVVSSQGMSYRYNIEHVIKDYMKDVFKVVKRKNPELKFNNNYVNSKYIDLFDNLIEEYDNLIQTPGYYFRTLKDVIGEKFELKKEDILMGDEGKRAILLSIMELFGEQFPNIVSNPLLALDTTDLNQRKLANFYILLSLAYLYYSHENVEYNEKLSLMDKNMFTAPTVPNSNINIIITNLQKTIDSISEECDLEYSKNIRSFVMDYYKACGYTSAENFTIGSLNRLFNNLYETDEKGNRLLTFKNPYNDPTLKSHERIFLKKVLFYFNKYRFKDNDNKKFTSWDDPEIPKYILAHGEYLNVPLKRASDSTHRQRLFSILDKIDNAKRVLKVIFRTKGKELYNEFVNEMTEDEAEYFRQGMDSMKFHDPFQRSEKERKEYIEKHGINYFETNVEDLLAERLFSSVYTEKINRMLLGTKSLLLLMAILGENSGTEKIFKDEQEFILKYIGLHVFKQPITDSGVALKIMAIGLGIRKNVTFLNIAGNVISAARDIENGFMENYIRTASKYMTNISAKNLSKAYAYVVKNGSLDAMKMTLISKLCVKYRLSNTDTARIVERLKTGRQGLANWDNVFYATLRAPDFLNRMTLFVAQAMEDGVLDAWEVKDNELVYNWRKDKRFNLLTNDSNKNNPKYKEQKALYMMYIKQWNQDHPDPSKQLKYDDDLPTPYSNQEIIAIKEVADNIYGSYDRSKRQMGDFTAIGTFFGMYTTWMNGIWNNWMMKPGKYNVSKMATEQETDLEGNLLFLDDNGNIYTEITNEDGTKKYVNLDSNEELTKEYLNPVLKQVPIPVQGIIYTLKLTAKILKNDGRDAAIKYMTDDPNTWNSLIQLMITGFLAALFAILFKFVLDPAYEKAKKSYKDMDGINILFTELVYRPLKPATDSLYGIYNVIKYLGENTDPPIYNVPTKFVADAWKTAFGNKTVGQFVSGNFAFARIFKQLANIDARRTATYNGGNASGGGATSSW